MVSAQEAPAVKASSPGPFWMIRPAGAPSRLAAPPASTFPVIVVVPAPLSVKSLMTVWMPHTVKFLPGATVHDWGAPTVSWVLSVALSLAVIPPAVTVSAPPLNS